MPLQGLLTYRTIQFSMSKKGVSTFQNSAVRDKKTERRVCCFRRLRFSPNCQLPYASLPACQINFGTFPGNCSCPHPSSLLMPARPAPLPLQIQLFPPFSRHLFTSADCPKIVR